MLVETSVEKEVYIVKITGEFMLADIEHFRGITESAIKDGHRKFIIDMNEVTAMDSSGAASLVALQKQLRRKKSEVILLNVYGKARKTLEFTRLNRLFITLYNYDEAFFAFRDKSGKDPNK